MVTPAVDGIDLFKIAGRSIEGKPHHYLPDAVGTLQCGTLAMRVANP